MEGGGALQRPNRHTSVARSMIAGSAAGIVEIAVAFPAEFAKTRIQLHRRIPGAAKPAWPPFGSAWYTGCSTLMVGTCFKTGIRFFAFDQYKSLLSTPDGTISGPRTVIAGFGAGVTESLLAVTPFESIKTTLIDEARRSASTTSTGVPLQGIQPQLQHPRSFLAAIPHIYSTRGLRGFFQGFVPTTARQALNSATRFGSYTIIKQAAHSYAAPGERLGLLATFGIGGLAGLVTVYVTQPLDTVKTRMQSVEARAEYRNSLECGARIVREEGWRMLWAGALPRLLRMTLSTGIVFAVYEKTVDVLEEVDPQARYL